MDGGTRWERVWGGVLMGWLIFSTMFGGVVIVVLGNLVLSRRHHFALDNASLSRGIISRSSVVSTMWISCP